LKLKNASAAFALLGVSALVLSGCAAAPDAEPTASETTSAAEAPTVDYLACAVSDEGSWNDKSFNESTYDALLKAEAELGVQIGDAESNSPDDFPLNLQAMVDLNCDVTFAVGFGLIDSVNATAEANPDMNFVTIDGFSMGATNLKPINYAMEESSYLAGYLAAAYSTTKVVGTYGGAPVEAVTAFMDGFYYGAKAYGRDNEVEVTVLGWDPTLATPDGQFMGNFDANSGVSKSIAAAQINAGADVIFPVAGFQFGAVSEAFKEAGVAGVMVGVDKDIALTSPEYADLVLTSAEKRMTSAVYDVIAELSAGGMFSPDAYIGTLANGGTGLSPLYGFEGKVSAEVIARLAELEAGIISGQIDPMS
jgi:basic membrane protein A